tara:strand:+ start:754 stop:1881 length:1128 start_codon:yes stop_codon:yes gene_type:complete
MSGFIPVNIPLISEGNERKYVLECIDTGWISSEGPFVKKFEEQFASYFSSKHAITVSNGTVALDAAIEAIGIKPGDEVIIPTFTIISCASSVVKSGGVPVPVDCDPRLWNSTPHQIEAAITSKTKAIMVVHIYGLPVDMDPILDLAKKHGLLIIEDTAQAIGLKYKDRLCGTMGDVACFSFYPNKHITTGEGGMVMTNSDKIADKVRSIRNLCFQPEKRFFHEDLGSNMRITNIQAALGLAQLEQLDGFLIRKREIGKRYIKNLQHLSEYIELPVEKTEYAENCFWVFGILVKDDMKTSTKEIMAKLGENGIGTRPFFFPMHLQPALHKLGYCSQKGLNHSEYIAENGFYVPSGLGISNDEIDRVCNVLSKVLKG